MSMDRFGGSMMIGKIRQRKRERHAERETGRERERDRTLSLRSSTVSRTV